MGPDDLACLGDSPIPQRSFGAFLSLAFIQLSCIFSLGDLEEMSSLWIALLEPITAGELCLLGEVPFSV